MKSEKLERLGEILWPLALVVAMVALVLISVLV